MCFAFCKKCQILCCLSFYKRYLSHGLVLICLIFQWDHVLIVLIPPEHSTGPVIGSWSVYAVITALASSWVFPLQRKTTGCWEQWGKILFFVPEPFMLLCDRVGSWEPLQATCLPPFSYPPLYYLCSCLRHGHFLVCQGELRLSVLRLECRWDVKKW